jgi:hypothetical protein
VAQLLALGNAAGVPEDLRARHLAHAVRKPLLQRVGLPQEFFVPLMAAAVSDPDPGFCRWFVEPAVYAFGCRRVMTALLDICGRVRIWGKRAPSEPGTAPTCRCARTGPRPTRPVGTAIPAWTSPTTW